jgi:hypothetical protein
MKTIEIDISSSQKIRAKNLYDFHNIKNSITAGDSQLYGAIGEILVMDYIKLAGLPCEYEGTYDYDLRSDVVTIDVKTKRVNCVPEKHHNANIPAYNTKQNTFLYFWVYVSEDMKRGWLIGWLDKKTYFEEATLHRKGDDDHGGWQYKADTYSMQIKDLICPDDLISNLKQIHMSKTKEKYEEVREDLGIEFQPQMSYALQGSLYRALANFQQEVPVIHKATQGYGYTYADLTKIIQVINPLLAKHGLGYTQPLMGSSVKTIVFHIESGESIESVVDIPQGVALAKMNDFQVLGSAITYLRRYSLASILTLITDADLDASGEQIRKESKPISNSAPVEKPSLNDTDFIKLCGAINAGNVHNGEVINEAWATKMYSLTPEQVKTIQMLNK